MDKVSASQMGLGRKALDLLGGGLSECGFDLEPWHDPAFNFLCVAPPVFAVTPP